MQSNPQQHQPPPQPPPQQQEMSPNSQNCASQQQGQHDPQQQHQHQQQSQQQQQPPPPPPPQMSMNGHVDYGPTGGPVAVPVSVPGMIPGPGGTLVPNNPVDLSSPASRHPLDPHDRRQQQYKHHTLQPIGTILHNLGKILFYFHNPTHLRKRSIIFFYDSMIAFFLF